MTEDHIDEKLLPPVLNGVNGLKVLANGKIFMDAVCKIEGNRLSIRSEELRDTKKSAWSLLSGYKGGMAFYT